MAKYFGEKSGKIEKVKNGRARGCKMKRGGLRGVSPLKMVLSLVEVFVNSPLFSFRP